MSSTPSPTSHHHHAVDDNDDAPLHLVFFPFLSRSHLTPILSFAGLAAARGAIVTIITTPSFAPLLPASIVCRPLLLPFPAAAFGLPDGCEDLSLLPRRLYPAFLSAVHSLHLPLRSLLPLLRPRPSALVSDALHHWAPSLALDLSLPHLLFHTFGLFPASAIAALHEHQSYRGRGRREPFVVTGFPHPVTVSRAMLPEVFDHEPMLPVYREAERRSWGVAVNTFREMEHACAELYERHVARAFLVGPACSAREEGGGGGGDPVMTWLEGIGGEGEVVYVCFGSSRGGRMGREQMREIALGMEACGRPYVWAMPTDYEDDTWMPQGYEERVSDRAMVVRRWVPQQEILAHRAIGGFVCHCGWNSIMEAVCAGVPMATWPLHSEQFLNEKMVVEVLRIGVAVMADDATKSVIDEEKAVVPAEAVARAVEQLMGDEEKANAMRQRVKKLSWLGQNAVAEGGSSYNDLGRMLDGLKALLREQQLRDIARPSST